MLKPDNENNRNKVSSLQKISPCTFPTLFRFNSKFSPNQKYWI